MEKSSEKRESPVGKEGAPKGRRFIRREGRAKGTMPLHMAKVTSDTRGPEGAADERPSAIDFGQFRLRPAFFFDFGQFRLRPISTSANFDFGQFLDIEFWDDNVWGFRRVGPRRVGQRKSGAPKGGAPKGRGPRRVGAQKGGAQKGGAQKGGGAQNFALFFPLPPQNFFLSSSSLLDSFRGILVVLKRRNPEVHVWSSRAVVCEPRRERRMKIVAGGGKKKSEISGGPAEGGSPEEGSSGFGVSGSVQVCGDEHRYRIKTK